MHDAEPLKSKADAGMDACTEPANVAPIKGEGWNHLLRDRRNQGGGPMQTVRNDGLDGTPSGRTMKGKDTAWFAPFLQCYQN